MEYLGYALLAVAAYYLLLFTFGLIASLIALYVFYRIMK